ncbi:hypothetical protein BSKO_01043 [Bryopsis sp. KO-2023]|nr:hypothetical protein BSKO_01043 [Bryopsis sp. KO-2023]
MEMHRSVAGAHAASSGRCVVKFGFHPSLPNRCLRNRRKFSVQACASPNRREFGAALGAFGALQLAPAAQGVETSFCDLGASYVCVDSEASDLVRIETVAYALQVPTTYQKLADNGGTDSELILRFKSPSGKQSASLVRREAASVKPTFLQLSDISQYGSLEQVASIVVPRSGREVSGEMETFPQMPFDTRTPRGIVQQPDLTIYRYKFTLADGKVALAVGALRGKVYYWGISATPEEWEAEKEKITRMWRSFRLMRQGVL